MTADVTDIAALKRARRKQQIFENLARRGVAVVDGYIETPKLTGEEMLAVMMEHTRHEISVFWATEGENGKAPGDQTIDEAWDVFKEFFDEILGGYKKVAEQVDTPLAELVGIKSILPPHP
jgi:hypothetical protein